MSIGSGNHLRENSDRNFEKQVYIIPSQKIRYYREDTKFFQKLLKNLLTSFQFYAILYISNEINGCPLPSDGRKKGFMAESKMTMREFFTAIISNEITDAIIEKATAELEKLDARNEKRASKPSKTAEANGPLITKLEEYLEGKEPMIASDIASALEMTPNKVASLAKASEKIKTTKTRHKGREVNQYSIEKEG